MMPGVVAVQQELWDTIFNGTDFANGIEFDSTNDNTLILNSNIGDNTVSSPNNSNSMVFVNDGVSNACIRYCTIDGTNGPGDGNGVQLSSVTGSTGFKIENCTIKDCQANGIITGESHSDLQIRHNVIDDVALNGTGAGKHGIYCQADGAYIGDNDVGTVSGGNGISIRVGATIRNNQVAVNGTVTRPQTGSPSAIKYYGDHNATAALEITGNTVDKRNVTGAGTPTAYETDDQSGTNPPSILIDDNETITTSPDSDDHVTLDGALSGITTFSNHTVTQI